MTVRNKISKPSEPLPHLKDVNLLDTTDQGLLKALNNFKLPFEWPLCDSGESKWENLAVQEQRRSRLRKSLQVARSKQLTAQRKKQRDAVVTHPSPPPTNSSNDHNFTPRFHQRQVAHMCGQHVVSNLMQEDRVDEQVMDAIAAELDAAERQQNMALTPNTPLPYFSSDGNYSVDVIERALDTCNIVLTRMVPNHPPPVNTFGYVIHIGSHWFALRKFSAEWWNLDSLLPSPKKLLNFSIENFVVEQEARQLGTATVYYVVDKMPPSTEKSI